ncbi:MAG: DUF2339 domain-containing protein [Gammaproteobacteria bacterium]
MDVLLFIGAIYTLFLLALPFLLWGLFLKIQKLQDQVRALEAELAPAVRPAVAAARPVSPSPRTTATSTPAQTQVQKPEKPARTPEEEPREIAQPAPAPKPQPVEPEQAPEAHAEATPAVQAVSRIYDRVVQWLLGGNTVARVGVVVLFFGVAFLLKYAAERGMFPIELRLAGAALGGLMLVLLGWRLRTRRYNYALVLQGGGTGIMYLTVFAAFHLYHMLPGAAALVLMVVLVALTSALAVLEDARSLAVLAAVGGFLAPVLISSGGSHVHLFTYYAVLDAGILGIAWFKAWRELNLLGFIFTFVIGAMWGYRAYRPEHFATTEPFLILFFVFYVLVPVLFAHRHPPQLKGYVDGTLVFGVPLVAFGLQVALVHEFEYGTAISALAVGLFYAFAAMLVWRRNQASLRMLVEAFLALAVAFGTLAIPMAVDGRWTGAAWALEGAALVWIGVRQQRRLARAFGVLVQLGAGVAFLADMAEPVGATPVFNSFYLSALLVSLAGLLSGYLLYRHRDRLQTYERLAPSVVLGWGLLWWFAAGIHEVFEHVPVYDKASVSLLFIALSCGVMGWVARRLDWDDLHVPLPALLPAMILFAVYAYGNDPGAQPLARWWLPAWAAAFAVDYRSMWRFEKYWNRSLQRSMHLGTLWLALFLIVWEGAWAVDWALPEDGTWSYAVWGLLPALTVMLLPVWGERLAWPVRRFRDYYLGLGLGLVTTAMLVWVFDASVRAGDPRPLPFLPLLNPLELTQAFVLVAGFGWLWRTPPGQLRTPAWYAFGAAAFAALNGAIARAMHFIGDVPFYFHAMWHTARYQTAVSIVWTIVALAIMVVASRSQRRQPWFVGATLLGLVVAKLFLVDLAGVGTVARIVSFVVAGLLILLIGYLSPLPPKQGQEEEQP